MSSKLKDISPTDIRRNPDNPRIYFRDEEMDTLSASIRRYGIQVPITVYSERNHFVLIDGERRWRCAKKLNLPTIPALIKEKPSPLNNLLLMFNIHALREQWDYLTIARKLPNVIELFQDENEGREPTEIELSEITGLTRGQIRRCRFLLDLPPKYRDLLEDELSLPKHIQKLSEDFFIEMERALKTVASRAREILPNASAANAARDALIKKFREETIGNITDFRMLSKIATSVKSIGVKESKAFNAIKEILKADNKVGIREIYDSQFASSYDERRLELSIDAVSDYLKISIDEQDDANIDDAILEKLKRLGKLIDKVLSA